MEYISSKEAAEKWGVTRRRVQTYCIGGRIQGAVKVSAVWLIPKDSKNQRIRVKNRRFLKMEGVSYAANTLSRLLPRPATGKPP